MSGDNDPVADEPSPDELAERDDLADEAEAADEAEICSTSTKTADEDDAAEAPAEQGAGSPGPVCSLRYCRSWR